MQTVTKAYVSDPLLNPYHPYDRIEMIKSMRRLCTLLGKLGISHFKYESWLYKRYQIEKRGVIPNEPEPEKWSYGIGLKEAKDWTERYLDKKILKETLDREARAAAT